MTTRIIRLPTEHPETDLWRVLLRYAYESNINAAFKGFGVVPQGDVTAAIITNIQQARAYFTAARGAALDISPLLLYYGATNLLAAVAMLRTGRPLNVSRHGMHLELGSSGALLKDAILVASDGQQGILHALSTIMCPDDVSPGGVTWSLQEILGRIPDVALDFGWTHKGAPAVLRVRVIDREFETVERLEFEDLPQPFPPEVVLHLLSKVKHFSASYLEPQRHHGALVLFRRRGSQELGVYTLDGRKALVLGAEKRGKVITPSQPILFLMGLYVLGSLSRYYAHVWHPLVHRDVQGERMVIERVVSIAQRYVPQLALEYVYNARWRFDTQHETPEDARETLSPEDVRQAIMKDRAAERLADGHLRYDPADL